MDCKESIDNATTLYQVRELHFQGAKCTTLAIDNAAERGDLKSIKWLFNNRTEGCTNDAAFLAAINNHVEVFQWLHENNKISACPDMVVNLALSEGNVEFVEYMCKNFKLDRSTFLMSVMSCNNNNRQKMMMWVIKNMAC